MSANRIHCPEVRSEHAMRGNGPTQQACMCKDWGRVGLGVCAQDLAIHDFETLQV